jgi:hypothetical protein
MANALITRDLTHNSVISGLWGGSSFLSKKVPCSFMVSVIALFTLSLDLDKS